MALNSLIQRVLVCAIIALICLLYGLSLAGCVSTSPGIPNIFLAQISNTANFTQSSIQIRVGYFGMCNSQGQSLSCANTYGSSPAAVAASIFSGQNGTAHAAEAQSLISFGLVLQNKIIVPLLACGGFFFLFGVVGLLSFQLFLKKGSLSPKWSSWLAVIIAILLWSSLAFASAAIASTTMAIAGMSVTTQQIAVAGLGVSPGTTLQLLQWVLLVFSVVFTFGATIVLWRGGSGAGPLASSQGSFVESTTGSQSKFEPSHSV